MSKKNIVVICRQNVGRSQMGEGFLRALTVNDPDVSVASAGIDTNGMQEKYDNHPHPQVVDVMQEEGIDISQQRITQATTEMLHDATKVVVLVEEKELPDEYREFLNKMTIIPINDPEPGANTEIQNLELQHLRQIRDQIKQAMSQVMEK